MRFSEATAMATSVVCRPSVNTPASRLCSFIDGNRLDKARVIVLYLSDTRAHRPARVISSTE
jgi:hypothetical protein